MEYYLPLFFEQTACLFDYLPADACTYVLSDLDLTLEQFWLDATGRYESRKGDRLRPLVPPKQLFLNAEEFYAGLKPLSRINLTAAPAAERAGHANLPLQPLLNLAIDARAIEPLGALELFWRIVISAFYFALKPPAVAKPCWINWPNYS